MIIIKSRARPMILAAAALTLWLGAATASFAAATCTSHFKLCMGFCSKNRSASSVPTLSACQVDCQKRQGDCLGSGNWQLGVNPRVPAGYAKGLVRQ